MLAYAKTSPSPPASEEEGGSGGEADVIVVVVNLDPTWPQSGWVEVPVVVRAGHPPYGVEDLLDGTRHTWRTDGWNYVQLDPAVTPAHIMRVPRPLVPESPLG